MNYIGYFFNNSGTLKKILGKTIKVLSSRNNAFNSEIMESYNFCYLRKLFKKIIPPHLLKRHQYF